MDIPRTPGGALTLDPSDLGTHPDGWTVTGRVDEDYYKWVQVFEAVHPKWGTVWGDFEDKVYATSERAYRKFVEAHPPTAWDKGDI